VPQDIPGESVTWLLTQGVLGFTTLLGFYLYFRSNARLEKEQEDHKATLRMVLPLVEKFNSTNNSTLPLVMQRADRRDQ